MAADDLTSLKDALRESLERRGVLGSMRSAMRREVFTAMEDPEDARPVLSGENMLINELIREYLAFNNYRHTLACFLPEAGQPAEPLTRSILARRTHLPELTGSAVDVPLLYALLSTPPEEAKPTLPPPTVALMPPPSHEAPKPPPPPPQPSSTHHIRVQGPAPVIFS